jgi:hypothetical protein
MHQSDQPQRPHTDVATSSNYNMIMHDDAQGPTGIDHEFGHVNIGSGRRWIT